MSGWRRTRLKYVARCNERVLSESTDPDLRFKYVDISGASQGAIEVPVDEMRFRDAPSRARRLAGPGDSVISTVRTYLRAVAPVPSDVSDLVFSTGFAVLRPDASAIEPRFLTWLLQGDEFIDRVVASSTGVSYPAITASTLTALDLRLPAMDEQRAIADYLDRETAQIDALIAKQEQLIATLRERYDAAWSALIAPVESKFGVVALRRCIESIADGPFGSSLTSAHYTDEGARVVRLGNIGINRFREADAAFISAEYYEELEAHHVRAGDVVVAGLGDDRMPLGRAAVVPEIGPAIVKADCYRLRLRDGVHGAYLAQALSSPRTRPQISLLARGATRARLNTSIVRDVTLPLPPLEEQHRIVAELDAQTAQIDELIDKTERCIALAKERRAALITAAVTGQIAVPGFDPAADPADETTKVA